MINKRILLFLFENQKKIISKATRKKWLMRPSVWLNTKSTEFYQKKIAIIETFSLSLSLAVERKKNCAKLQSLVIDFEWDGRRSKILMILSKLCCLLICGDIQSTTVFKNLYKFNLQSMLVSPWRKWGHCINTLIMTNKSFNIL